MSKEQSENYAVENEDALGTVKIADDVVAIIAGLAATEVEGVTSMAGNITNELVGKLGVKNLSKGVRIEVDGDEISVTLAINIAYGYNIPEVSKAVQGKSKEYDRDDDRSDCCNIDIRIVDVDFDNDK